MRTKTRPYQNADLKSFCAREEALSESVFTGLVFCVAVVAAGLFLVMWWPL